MTDLEPNRIKDVRSVSKADVSRILPDIIQHLEFKQITAADRWLEVAYAMLAAEFGREELDSYERHVIWANTPRRPDAASCQITMTAFLRLEDQALVVGVISGTIMPIAEHGMPSSSPSGSSFLFPIGHQVTAAALRDCGIRGVGSRLWHTAHWVADEWARSRMGMLRYSFGESQDRSIRYNMRMGYRWPRGVKYWQPPIDFDSNGNYVHPEVPETLMIMPLGDASREKIGKILLQEIIATVYRNWYVNKYQNELSVTAVRRVESYIMDDLFGRVCQLMPDDDEIPLVVITGPETAAL